MNGFARRLLAAAALALATSNMAVAQSYPARPVKIIVSSAAGGPLDIVARAVAEKLTTSLKQPVVVEARSGAGGNIAADLVSKAEPDGYTLLFVLSSTLTVNPHLYKDLNFNLKPITVVNYSTQTLFVHPSLPVNNLSEFVAWAKKEGPVTYAHGGAGTSSHLVMEYFRLLAGFETVPVPYRGSAAAVTDVLSGRVDVMVDTATSGFPRIASGQFRALAVTSPTRFPLMPEAPTVAEFVPGYEASGWNGVCAPKGTPADIVRKLNNAINAALADPKLKARLADLGATPLGGSSSDFGTLIAEETAKWSKVIRAGNIKPG